jgi:ABC-type multidrug transport system fused ATPase/permease subunit
MFFSIYFEIKKNLSKYDFFHFNLFILFSIIAMILEMIGISLIIPIIKILTTDQIFFSKFEFLNNLELNQYSKINLILISLISLVFIYFFKTIFLTFVSYKQIKFITDIRKITSERLFKNYLNRSYGFFLDKNSSELIRNINDISNFCVLIRSVLMLVTEFVILIGILLLLIIYEPLGSTSIILIIGAIGILFSSKLKKKAEFWGGERRIAAGHKLKAMQESFVLIKEIKVSNLNKYFISKFITSNNLSAKYQFKHEFVLSLPRYWFELIAIFGFSILILFLTYINYDKSNIIEAIGLFAAAIFRLVPSIIKVINNIQQIHFSLPVLNNLSEEFNLENKEIRNNEVNFNRKFIMKKSLILKDVSFKYPNSNKQVLHNINLKIKAGSIVGIIGPSGVGKTTLVNIILGLLMPTTGKVLVDDIEISKNICFWQKCIGYVPQNIVLTDDSLKNNIALGIEENQINKNRINNCIKETQLLDFVLNAEKGIDENVGELGSKLSGGQKQRIGIARSIYNDPQILILDEFTSSLDNYTEEKIINEISNYKKKKTIIIISHRLSTLSKCDDIYELAKGNLKLI